MFSGAWSILIWKRTGETSGGWSPRENPKERQRQKRGRERGRMFRSPGRHYGINGCGCKSFVGSVDAVFEAGRPAVTPREKERERVKEKDAFKKNPPSGRKGFSAAFMP